MRSDANDFCEDVCEAMEERAVRYWEAAYEKLRLLERYLNVCNMLSIMI